MPSTGIGGEEDSLKNTRLVKLHLSKFFKFQYGTIYPGNYHPGTLTRPGSSMTTTSGGRRLPIAEAVRAVCIADSALGGCLLAHWTASSFVQMTAEPDGLGSGSAFMVSPGRCRCGAGHIPLTVTRVVTVVVVAYFLDIGDLTT